MPAFQVTTVERIDAAPADRAGDDPSIRIVRAQSCRFAIVIRTRRLDLPEIDQRTDGTIKDRGAAATAGQPLARLRCEAMASREQCRLIINEIREIHPSGLKAHFD